LRKTDAGRQGQSLIDLRPAAVLTAPAGAPLACAFVPFRRRRERARTPRHGARGRQRQTRPVGRRPVAARSSPGSIESAAAARHATRQTIPLRAAESAALRAVNLYTRTRPGGVCARKRLPPRWNPAARPAPALA